MSEARIFCLPVVEDLAIVHDLLDALFALNDQLRYIDIDEVVRLHEARGLLLILDRSGFDMLTDSASSETLMLDAAYQALEKPEFPVHTLLLDFEEVPELSGLPDFIRNGRLMLYTQPENYRSGDLATDLPVDILDYDADDFVRFDVAKAKQPRWKLSSAFGETIDIQRYTDTDAKGHIVLPQGGVLKGAVKNSRMQKRQPLPKQAFKDLFKPVFKRGMAETAMAPKEGDPTIRDSGSDAIDEVKQEVFLGASAPETVTPGSEFTARFVAYVESEAENAAEKLEKGRRKKTVDFQAARCRWKKGVTVTVKLSGTDLDVDEPEQQFDWNGAMNDLVFDVTVNADAEERYIVLKYDVYIDELRVARIRLDLVIGKQTSNSYRNATAMPIKYAFASYASKDRLRVLDRVSAMKINSGIDIFQDCLSLHPNEEWKPQLAAEINNRDLFILFWSRHAKESPWVAWEIEQAYRKDPDAIQVQPLDPVDFAKPPKELAGRHFEDPAMIRWFYEAFLKEQAGERPD